MNKALIAIILILNIAGSQAVFLKKPTKATFNIFNQLKEIEDETFGKKILDTIALQLKNKSPLGDIAKMLAEIRTDLVTQQQEADQLHAAQEVECENEINEYRRRIDVATTTIAEAEAEITVLKGEIGQLQGEIKNKGIQLEILNQREVDLQNARAQDAEDFQNRQRQSVEVVGALDLIIEKFDTIQSNDNHEAVLAELGKIGSSNPIMALVQVASTFSQESLTKVTTALQKLQADLEASVEEDKRNEEAAIAEYQALLGEIQKTRKDVAQAKADAEAQLKQREGALQLQEKILEEAVAELKQAQEDKITKEHQCEEWRNKWATDKEQRTKEVNVVKQVESIIATKLETMKDYIKNRANGEE